MAAWSYRIYIEEQFLGRSYERNGSENFKHLSCSLKPSDRRQILNIRYEVYYLVFREALASLLKKKGNSRSTNNIIRLPRNRGYRLMSPETSTYYYALLYY